MKNQAIVLRFLIFFFVINSQLVISEKFDVKNYGYRGWKTTKASAQRAYEWLKKDRNILKVAVATAVMIVGYITLKYKMANWLVSGAVQVPQISFMQRAKAEMALAKAGLGWELFNLPASTKSTLPNLIVFIANTVVFPSQITNTQTEKEYLDLVMYETQKKFTQQQGIDLVKNPQKFAQAVLLYKSY